MIVGSSNREVSTGLVAWTMGLIAIATFLPSVANGFVFDDVQVVVEQTTLHSLSNFFEIISSPWWSVGVFGAVIGTAIFVVHPVHVEAVASVVGRAEVLVGLFAAVTALLYRWDGILASYDDRSWRRYIATGGTMMMLVLGLGSKENAVVIPGLLVLVDWMEAKSKNRSFDSWFRSHWILWVATLVLTLEWVWLRSELLGGLIGDDPAPGLEATGIIGRVIIMAPIALQYLRLLVFPLHLSADYSPNFVSVDAGLTVSAVAGFVLLAVMLVLVVMTAKRAPLVAFGLVWIAGSLSIVSNIIVPTGVLLAERTLYLPSIGLIFVVGYLATKVSRKHVTSACIVVSTIVSLGVVRTAYRIPVFKNDANFFPRLALDAPGSFRSLWVSGMMAYTIDDRALGERLLREAIVAFPLFPNVWHDFGRRMQEEDRWEEAAQAFSVAFSLDTTRVNDAANAVTNFVRNGNLDSAKAYAAVAARTDPFHPRVKEAFGWIATAEGRHLDAMTYHRQAAWLDPDEPVYWYRVARSALQASHCPSALAATRRLSDLDDGFPNLAALKQDADSLGCG